MDDVADGSLSLADQAYASIKASIVSCQLAPGERVTERLLADRYGFGLTPIRKALLRLDNEGLISTRARSGCRVAPLTIDDVESLFDAWGVLGSAIISRAAERCTPQDRADLVSTVRALRSRQRRDRTSASDAAVEIGQITWQAHCRIAGNPRLTEMYKRLDADLQRVFVIGVWGNPAHAERFLATFNDGRLHLDDPARSVEQFLQHINMVHQHVLEALQQSHSLRSHEIVLGDPVS